MQIVFVPFYIRLMGVESYGIVGFFAALTGMLAVLDLGLSQAMNREMARLSIEDDEAAQMADTARTLEIIYWCMALAVFSVMILCSGYIAYHWLNPKHLSRESLLQALWIMAFVIGLRWPVAIYSGGLNGLQKQVELNIIQIVFSTFQGAGALAVLWAFGSTIQVFFLWQGLVAFLQVIAMRMTLWRGLGRISKGRFSKRILERVWHFAVGMTGISLAATILTQMDKVILSRMLSLADFGYYTFAATVAAALYRIIGPIFSAYYPKLTELVSRNDHEELVKTYHQGCQMMSVAILPATLVLAFFSNEIMKLWTHNPEVVVHSSLLVSLLVIGNAMNGLMNIPYALQLAHGWTKLAFYQNLVALVILAPAIYFSTLRWGATGAAVVWIILNFGYLLFSIQIMHQRLLPQEKLRWYLDDTGLPLLAVLLTIFFARMIMQPETSGVLYAATILMALVATQAAAIISVPQFRHTLFFRESWKLRK